MSDKIDFYWQDSSKSKFLKVSNPGTYSLAATYDGVCKITDSITIYNKGFEFDLGPDTTLCPGEEMILDISDNSSKVVWEDGSTTKIKK